MQIIAFMKNQFTSNKIKYIYGTLILSQNYKKEKRKKNRAWRSYGEVGGAGGRGLPHQGPVSERVAINRKFYTICHWATIDIHCTTNRNPLWNRAQVPPIKNFNLLLLLLGFSFVLSRWKEGGGMVPHPPPWLATPI